MHQQIYDAVYLLTIVANCLGLLAHLTHGFPFKIQIWWKISYNSIAGDEIYTNQITTNLCTWHDSTAVILCAKCCSDQLIAIWKRVKPISIHLCLQWEIYWDGTLLGDLTRDLIAEMHWNFQWEKGFPLTEFSEKRVSTDWLFLSVEVSSENRVVGH